VIALVIPRGGEAIECLDCHAGEAWGRACETCNGHGYVVTENIMEREWSEIGESAFEIADALMAMDVQLGMAADRLQALIAKAADTKHEDDAQKAQAIGVWRATLEGIRASQRALSGGK
jgi:hypothetical protein